MLIMEAVLYFQRTLNKEEVLVTTIIIFLTVKSALPLLLDILIYS